MIRKSFIEFMLEAMSIERWNDHIRPDKGFQEIDKQSHKMFYAYALSSGCDNIDYLKLIEGSIFEFLHRLTLTDIKPPIFHRLMQEKGESINEWVLETLRQHTHAIPLNFYDKFERYLLNPTYSAPEKNILNAAHYLATKWEFDIIYGMSPSFNGIEDTKTEIYEKIVSFEEFDFFRKFEQDPGVVAFTDFVGGLRLQQRWARTPRIPQTSVMGHMYMVAMLSYFASLEIGSCEKRIINNFLGGLFHDLPEVLTRDIVSPVKSSVQGLDDLIKEIESSQMVNVIYKMLPDSWRDSMNYYTKDEFASKIKKSESVLKVTSDAINTKYNYDKFDPIDGEIIRGCDHLSAFLETYLSITCGIRSAVLVDGNKTLYKNYQNKIIGNMDFGLLFDYFKI